MRSVDYLRLGFVGVKAHKRRAFTVVIIVGLLFGVVMAGTFILQGLENVILGTMLAPTSGKVLVMSNVDRGICGEECDIPQEMEAMKRKVEEYGGEVLEARAVHTTDGMFYEMEEDIFGIANDDDDAMQVAVSLKTAMKLAEIGMLDWNADMAKKAQDVERVRGEVLGKVVESRSGVKYQIVEILPGAVYLGNLYLSNLGQKGNPLDSIIGPIGTGASLDFVVSNAGEASETGALGVVFASFPDVESADSYYRDEANYCLEIDRTFGMCNEKYRYQIASMISSPLEAYEKFRDVWLVFKIAAAVLAVIALIIAFSTYVRLIGKDMKIISLYHAMGATGWQIRIVYIVYLLMLSLMAIGFALVLGLGLAAGLSLINMEALRQLWLLGFGVEVGEIWLIGWNNLVWWLMSAMVLVAVVTVILGNSNFTSRELAGRIK